MKAGKNISIFLIFVLAMQLLPVRQTISWLLRNQVTEELADAKSGSKNIRSIEEDHKLLILDHFHIDICRHQQKSTLIHHFYMALTARHADDIPTPPPNY